MTVDEASPAFSLAARPHPLLVARAFTTVFPTPIGALPRGGLAPLLRLDAPLPAQVRSVIGPAGDPLRAAIRDLLRAGGFKPTGRSKPASEYLIKAAEGGFLGPINPAVDANNAVSLHTGFPISVVDLDRASPGPAGTLDLRIAVAPDPPGTAQEYVFNASGQTIDIEGLLCLYDAAGPCANAVKDAQRTKTTDETTRTLSVIWGVRGHEAALDAALAWYRDLLAGSGHTAVVPVGSFPEP